MSHNEVDPIEVQSKRRWEKLKEQQARYGDKTPPEILMEIEDIEEEFPEMKKQPTRQKTSTPPNVKGQNEVVERQGPRCQIYVGIAILLVVVFVFIGLIGGLASINKVVAMLWPTPTNTPTDTPVPPTDTPTPTPFTISNLNWQPYQGDGLGSTISVEPVPGTDDTIKISFNLKDNGWVSTYKKLDPESLSQTESIRFSYIGTGAPNTLELKLIERDETIFEVIWYGVTSTGGQKISWEVSYSDSNCRKDSSARCQTDTDVQNLRFNPENVDRIDFSFSNQIGDEPGSGEVIIEAIQVIPND